MKIDFICQGKKKYHISVDNNVNCTTIRLTKDQYLIVRGHFVTSRLIIKDLKQSNKLALETANLKTIKHIING